MHAFLTLRESGFDIDITSENDVEDSIFAAFKDGRNYPASVSHIERPRSSRRFTASELSFGGLVEANPVAGLTVKVSYEKPESTMSEEVADVVDGGRGAEPPVG